MEISEHLDKIQSLGFQPVLYWNNSFQITYEVENINYNFNQYPVDLKIMMCNFQEPYSNLYTYEDMLEVCCDIFYGWYNKNLHIIKELDTIADFQSYTNLEDIVMGDITKVVARELNLSDLLD
jgi:hypothetical protein